MNHRSRLVQAALQATFLGCTPPEKRTREALDDATYTLMLASDQTLRQAAAYPPGSYLHEGRVVVLNAVKENPDGSCTHGVFIDAGEPAVLPLAAVTPTGGAVAAAGER